MSRETVKAELADKIVAGIVKSDFDPMEHIGKLDREALDNLADFIQSGVK